MQKFFRPGGSRIIKRQQYNNSFGDFNTSLETLERSSRQKINTETVNLNNTIDRKDIAHINNIPSSSTRKHIFPRCAWNILQNRSYDKSHKTSLSKLKETEIIANIFYNNNDMKLEIMTGGKRENSQLCRKVTIILLNNQWVKEEIKREIKHLEQMKTET